MKKLSHIELRQLITRLNRLDLTQANYEALCVSVGRLATVAKMPIEMSRSTEFFFRIRKNPSKKPNMVSDLGAPPAIMVTGFQRCNPPEHPIFYASSNRLTALKEARVKAGDTVFLSHWIAKEPMPFNHLFQMDNWDENSFPMSNAETTLHAYWDTLFSRKIHETFSDEYKLTAAIACKLMENYETNEIHDIREDKFVGLRYPSVANVGSGYNIALKPLFAEQRLNLLHVTELAATDGEDGELCFEVLDNARGQSDGKFDWTGNPNSLPQYQPLRNKLLFESYEGNWCLPVHDQPPTENSVIGFLREEF